MYVSLLVGNLQELDSAGVRAVARGLPQLGLAPVWSSDHSGNLARVLRATTARNALLQPVMERIVVRRSRHDSTKVEQQIAVVPPAELAAKLWEVNPKLLFGESAGLDKASACIGSCMCLGQDLCCFSFVLR